MKKFLNGYAVVTRFAVIVFALVLLVCVLTSVGIVNNRYTALADGEQEQQQGQTQDDDDFSFFDLPEADASETAEAEANVEKNYFCIGVVGLVFASLNLLYLAFFIFLWIGKKGIMDKCKLTAFYEKKKLFNYIGMGTSGTILVYSLIAICLHVSTILIVAYSFALVAGIVFGILLTISIKRNPTTGQDLLTENPEEILSETEEKFTETEETETEKREEEEKPYGTKNEEEPEKVTEENEE